MIIGFTGNNAAGKTEACKYLESLGFKSYSLSDAIRLELEKQGKDSSRDNMIELGNKLRSTLGPGVLAMKIRDEFGEGWSYAVDSIRNPSEVEELRKEEGFVLVGVDASVEARFERIAKRGRVGDPKTLEELKEFEERENSKDAAGQQLDACFSMADFVIVNDDSLDDFHKKIDEVLEGLR